MNTNFRQRAAASLTVGAILALWFGAANPSDPQPSTAPPETAKYQSFGRSRTPFDAAFAADGRAVVVGRGGLLSVLAKDARKIAGTMDIGTRADLLAIALGPDGMLRATDGEGTIWRINAALDQAVPEAKTGEGALFSVQYTSKGTGIAVGQFGTVLIKRPDAPDWRREEFNWSELLPDLAARVGDLAPHLYRACPRPDGGVLVVGEYGVVLDYSDDRVEVRQAAQDVGNLFACLSDPDGLDLVGGQSGKLFYRTAPFGPWLAGDSAGSFDIYDLALDETDFLAVGQGAVVMVSTDGTRWLVSDSASLPGTDWIVRALPAAGRTLLIGKEGYLLANGFRRLSKSDAARQVPLTAAHSSRKAAP